MSSFDIAVGVVLAHEGGFVDNPTDDGGATNYGISSAWLKSQGFPCDHDAVKSITEDDAKNFYFNFWWSPQRYGEITDQDVATKCLDGSVNMGCYQANKLLQRSLCDLGRQIDVDGKIGPHTLLAVNLCDPKLLITKMISAYCAFYRGLVASQPRYSTFLSGWLHRANWPIT